MVVIFFLIVISLTIAAGFLGAFVWAVRAGQFEDDYTPSVRILFEDQAPMEAGKPENNPHKTDKYQKSQP